MRRVTMVAAAVAVAVSVISLANCQRYEAEPVSPRAFGTVTEPHVIQGAKTPPYVMLVVDRSGSMQGQKLNDVKNKFASASGFLAKTGAGAEFGLILFGNTAQTCQPGTIVQPVGASTDQVRQSINSAISTGGTPTAASLKAVLDDPKMNTPEAERDRFVMLLTDGAPNCNPALNDCARTTGTCDPGWQCCLDDVATIQQVTELANRGIKTFVIGFGSETGDRSGYAYEVLNRAAEAGGLARSGETKFYQADDSTALAEALDAFGSVILTCNYTLAEAAQEELLQVVFVYTNEDNREQILNQGSEWTYSASSRQLSIIGSRCTEIEKGPSGLKVEFRYVTSL
jgi:Mg-chelatase subunit ChlD